MSGVTCVGLQNKQTPFHHLMEFNFVVMTLASVAAV
jgi:hypothetical protein